MYLSLTKTPCRLPSETLNIWTDCWKMLSKCIYLSTVHVTSWTLDIWFCWKCLLEFSKHMYFYAVLYPVLYSVQGFWLEKWIFAFAERCYPNVCIRAWPGKENLLAVAHVYNPGHQASNPLAFIQDQNVFTIRAELRSACNYLSQSLGLFLETNSCPSLNLVLPVHNQSCFKDNRVLRCSTLLLRKIR